MSYKKGMSKAKFKATMRMFWTERWKYERTPEEWVNDLQRTSGVVWSSGSIIDNPTYSPAPWGKRAEDLLFSAVDKLVLERKIFKKQGERMKEMIASEDKENVLVAIQIMAGLKPKKFKIIKVNEEYE